MPAIPPFILKKLYVRGSLRNTDGGFALELKNAVAPGTIIAFAGLDVDGQMMAPSQITLTMLDGELREANGISGQSPLSFDLGTTVVLHASGRTLEPGPHELAVHVVVQEIGPLHIPISDELA
jgi:hydroxymethylglutaryl-CoA reductase (NADPH)